VASNNVNGFSGVNIGEWNSAMLPELGASAMVIASSHDWILLPRANNDARTLAVFFTARR
jgi:hypothetical protein